MTSQVWLMLPQSWPDVANFHRNRVKINLAEIGTNSAEVTANSASRRMDITQFLVAPSCFAPKSIRGQFLVSAG